MRFFRKKPVRLEEKPDFRFYPTAYDNGGPLVASLDKCDCCRNRCVWKYTGNIYAQGEAIVCAGCIAAGNLNTLFAKGYSLHDIELESDVEQNVGDELFDLTPGVACFNPFEWPVANRMPLAFIGYGETLKECEEATKATEAAFAKIGWPDEKGPSNYALLFRPITGGPMRAVIDLD
ncbi:CbrC family protein [Pontixanthobacter sp.]|uniref:CbrC family protein n=1 Tax=Pontixanthobacter sp. TaxID=2792078 RepID=UPI003C7DB067